MDSVEVGDSSFPADGDRRGLRADTADENSPRVQRIIAARQLLGRGGSPRHFGSMDAAPVETGPVVA